MVIYIFGSLSILLLIGIVIGYYFSEKGYSGQISSHFDGSKFFNPNGKSGNGIKEVFKLIHSRKPTKWIENYETFTRDTLINDNLTDSLRLVFVNHSTFLIQVDSVNILIDPIWSDRCSPIQWMGPKRNRPPGITFNSLPKIDVVLISHNHYDHLDKNTVLKLQQKFTPQFIVPLGVSHFFRRLGIENVTEIDWNKNMNVNNLKITAMPAVHFSSRGLFDRDKTLWCGFMVEGSKTIYYAGDTAYDDTIFKTIGETFPNIDVAIIPIGAYKPNWFMAPIHTSPNEAVQIHLDIKSKKAIATHFGTFALADEGQGEAGDDLRKALEYYKIPREQFLLPDEGVFYTY
ncbi:MBL fold metallo-hydrolase [Aquimarina litoralis]|uniref:MBL fold metallo-hydrolase n=1 Tax=Aquimarina litoralis TaxID=584605 RepID=UPI0031D8DB08